MMKQISGPSWEVLGVFAAALRNVRFVRTSDRSRVKADSSRDGAFSNPGADVDTKPGFSVDNCFPGATFDLGFR